MPKCLTLLVLSALCISCHRNHEGSWEAMQVQAGSAPRSIQVKEDEAARHLMGDWPDIRLAPADSKRYQPFQGLHFNVTVSDTGDVVGAALDYSGDEELRPAGWREGESLLAQRHFKPFLRDGKAVYARFKVYLPVFPPERIPDSEVPFPELKDRSTLVIALRRGSCYGTCPDYTIEVHGDGKVEFVGRCFVAVRGRRSETISAESVDELLSLFRKADYWSLDNDYSSPATDLPYYETSIAFDGVRKSVADYYGQEVGMPDSVRAIENSIDRITHSGQWISRDGKWKVNKKEVCR